MNTDGSYYCGCKNGFHLVDGTNCLSGKCLSFNNQYFFYKLTIFYIIAIFSPFIDVNVQSDNRRQDCKVPPEDGYDLGHPLPEHVITTGDHTSRFHRITGSSTPVKIVLPNELYPRASWLSVCGTRYFAASCIIDEAFTILWNFFSTRKNKIISK